MRLYDRPASGSRAGVEPPPGVVAWLARVEATPGFVNDLAPFPEHARS